MIGLETFAGLAIFAVLLHGFGEWRGELASWSRMVTGPRKPGEHWRRGAFAPWSAPPWLELGLPIFATIWNGATIAAVVDPSRNGPAAIQCYADLAEAVEILEFKRARWEAARCQSDAEPTTIQNGPKRRRTRAK